MEVALWGGTSFGDWFPLSFASVNHNILLSTFFASNNLYILYIPPCPLLNVLRFHYNLLSTMPTFSPTIPVHQVRPPQACTPETDCGMSWRG